MLTNEDWADGGGCCINAVVIDAEKEEGNHKTWCELICRHHETD